MSLILSISECPPIYEEQELPQEITCSSGSLGRDANNKIVLPDPACYVSGRHALIEFNGDSYTLNDLSTNGTFLNNERDPIGAGRGVLLEDGDRIRIGGYVLAVRLDHTVIEHPTSVEITRKSFAINERGQNAVTRQYVAPDSPSEEPPVSPASPVEGSAEEQAQAWQTMLANARIEAGDAELNQLGAELGLMINAVTRGLMEILKTRTDVKEEFGVPLTRITPTENNPLKFSVTVEEALENLFIREGSSYMRGTETFVESLDDFRIHEMATMAAIRAAVDEMLARFDPTELKKQFQSGNARKAFMEKLQKAEHWDQYESWFAELAEDEQHFNQLFGKSFAKAYDEKVHRLASKKRGRK
jgi:predicted component of type VI protein secretion system